MTLHVQEMYKTKRKEIEAGVFKVSKDYLTNGEKVGLGSFLELDSLESVGYIIDLQDKFNISISDGEATAFLNRREREEGLESLSNPGYVAVGDVVDYLLSREKL